MDNSNIDLMFNEFNIEADRSKKILHEICEDISKGRVPTDTDVQLMNETIDVLRNRYESICLYAAKILPENEMPDEGATAEEYVIAINNSVFLEKQIQIKKIRHILESFISVRSLVAKYAEALEPYQKEASFLINKLNDEEETSIESIKQDAAGPELFVKTLLCDDLDSDEGWDLLGKVRDYYSNAVSIGLSRGVYELPNKNEEEKIGDDTLDNENGDVEEELDNFEILENGLKQLLNCGENTAHEGLCAEKLLNVILSDIEDENEKEFISRIYDSKTFFNPNNTFESFTENIHPNEDKPVSYKKFKNEIKRGGETLLKQIIQDIVKGPRNPEYFSIKYGMRYETVADDFDYLFQKGYLRKYSLPPYGEYYCLTKRLDQALSLSEAAKYIEINKKTPYILDDNYTSVITKISFIKLKCNRMKQLIHENGFCPKEDILYEFGRIQFNSFVNLIEYFDNARINTDLIIGVFWNNLFNLVGLYEWIKEETEEVTINHLVIAAFNLNEASCFAEIILDSFNETINYKEIELYSLEDDCYYSYPELAEIHQHNHVHAEIENVVGNADFSVVLDTEKNHDESAKNEETEIENILLKDTIEDTPVEKKITEDDANIDECFSIVEKEEEEIEIDNTNSEGKGITEKKIPEENIANEKKSPLSIVYEMLSEEKFYAALAYLKALSLEKEEFASDYTLLSYALNDPMENLIYSTEKGFEMLGNKGAYKEALIISIAIRIFFSNQVPYDYNIKSYYSGIKEFDLLKNIPSMGNLVYSLMEFKAQNQQGIDAYADYRFRNQAEIEKAIVCIQQEAKLFYENNILERKKQNFSNKRFLHTRKMMFSVNGDLAAYIKSIIDKDIEMLPLLEDFLLENFFSNTKTISSDTIETEKIYDYIDIFWEKAGETMVYQKHVGIKDHLKKNISKTLESVVVLLSNWWNLNTISMKSKEDQGSVAFKKIKGSLLVNIDDSIDVLKNNVSSSEHRIETRAGSNVIINTLFDIRNRITGTYEDGQNKYFYAPFLLTGDVMLDENYEPDLDMHSSTLMSIMPSNRIYEHFKKASTSNVSYEDRLNQILNEKGDDYGQAELIMNYMTHKHQVLSVDDKIHSTIQNGKSYAKEAAVIKRDNFVGELELAQSYGQIDNSEEDKKEKILQIIDRWYEWANETANYGFFQHIMEDYLKDIKHKAKDREKDLQEQLDRIKTESLVGISENEKTKRIHKIQEMIDRQNYTVAEDLLRRSSSIEEEFEEGIGEDFLKEFLDNYEEYYVHVASVNKTFSSLVERKTRNKEQRGARKLADNWLPGGGFLSKDKLNNLLICLGFKVDKIMPQSPIGKFEHYFVKLEKGKGGQRDYYTHPIAAFGSRAAEDSFRVICINGGYDSDKLIDVMKATGNAKHTIILLDYALSISERRRLARKTKNALGDKLFAVIDRTVMMFLIRHYDETKINRMLISLITPFGYYQPYVWESANVMPPEIFMGRKRELEKIKSPTGVNIVYGGRQLGKSALLKKAKEDIDHDENGNRAILVDIKGLDYKKAAKKIGHALFDEGILFEDISTENWDELARSVRRRLQSEKDRIPYLLLLLDEADKFIDSCGGEINYQPFDALKEVQGIGTGRFKFVIAGLRNIVRFKREALDNNSVLTHLEPMTVKPFNTSEARELMETPLHYLGLRFQKEKESLITLILATTNYFPGLIQMYCAKLVDAMRNKDYANYNEADTPIYEVSEEHIKKVLADPEFTQQIREKFEITLKLDEDNYYYLIALLMAFLYHNNDYNRGYSAGDIKQVGDELEISKISNLDVSKINSFMEELQELNVFRKTDTSHYLFARFTFFQMMGTRIAVEDKLEEYMGQ